MRRVHPRPVLVGAFNKVVAEEAAAKWLQERDRSLPEGFTDQSARGLQAAVLLGGNMCLNLLTHFAYGMRRVDSELS